MDERLVTLFYILMRDTTPTGALLDAINQSRHVDTPIFTNKDLENIARDYVKRLTEIN